MRILGISGFYHDAAAALVVDGDIVAAAQEERFTRVKHDPSLPVNAIAFCLRRGEVDRHGLDAVAFYDKPMTTFVRLLKTHFRVGPTGFASFHRAMPIWLREKLWIPYQIERALRDLGVDMPRSLYFTEHHEAHAASAFFPSPFDSAAVLTFDGVGEWATSSIGVGRGNRLELRQQLNFPHSIGLLYSAFTYHCGFRVNSGEYKLMGLAPYGEPTYVDKIRQIVEVAPDGSITLDMGYFGYLNGRRMTNRRFDALFDGPAREPESELTTRELDLAASIQVVTEDIVLTMARHAAAETGESRACLAGGVALNCVSNGRLVREGPFEEVWIQPAAGDAGGAVGAALYAWHQLEDGPRRADGVHDAMAGAYLGPAFSRSEIEDYLRDEEIPYRAVPDDDDRMRHVAELLAGGAVVGFFTGRMEFGPRALGHRSILGDPRSAEMQSTMNLKIKHRESFRPFAPAVLEERAPEWFDIDGASPYMMLTATVARERWHEVDPTPRQDVRARVNQVRSEIPAVTHVDHSARLQTVDADQSPELHALLVAFEELTSCPVLINTSFNVRGEPIVCTPEDAYRCFMRTEMDHLVLEHCVLTKTEQPERDDAEHWQASLVLD